jgi:hypothetical protein
VHNHRVTRLEPLLGRHPWMLSVLRARAPAPSGLVVGSGMLCDLVWDRLHGRFTRRSSGGVCTKLNVRGLGRAGIARPTHLTAYLSPAPLEIHQHGGGVPTRRHSHAIATTSAAWAVAPGSAPAQ